jgi:hypothetical protein
MEPMDLNKLSDGEKIAGVSAILLFIFMFLEWFTAEVSGGSGAFSVSASEGGSAWDALDNIPIFLVITIIAALVVVALRLTDSSYEPPVSANAIVAVLGAISVLLILYRIIDTPGEGGTFGGVSVDVSPAFGIFLGLIAAAGIAFGGYKAMQEEGASFSDFKDLGGGSPPPPPPSPSAATPPPPPAPAAEPPAPPPPAAPPEPPSAPPPPPPSA